MMMAVAAPALVPVQANLRLSDQAISDWNPTLAVERASPFSANIIMRRRTVTAACMMAIFMAAVEVTIVATAMPTIVADLGGARFFSWVFAAYLLTQAVSTPVYGRLADVYGRKRVFVAGSSLFLFGSAACGFTWSMASLPINHILKKRLVWQDLSATPNSVLASGQQL
jgi:MFS family permease